MDCNWNHRVIKPLLNQGASHTGFLSIPPSDTLNVVDNRTIDIQTGQRAIIVAAILASASAFAPTPAFRPATAVFSEPVDPNPAPKDNAEALEKGWSLGGKAVTKDPEPVMSDDPRLVIPKAVSFEEYMKSRKAEGK